MSDLRTTEHRLAGLLAEMARLQGWAALGYSSLGDYAAGALQLEPKKARDLARLGARLGDFPRLDAAMKEGTLPWTKARELVRVVAPDTEEAWIAKAQEISSRDLELLVSGSSRGDLPPERPSVSKPERMRLVIEVDAAKMQQVLDVLTEIQGRLTLDGEEQASLGEALFALTSGAVPRGTLEASYQVVLHHCQGCGETECRGHEVSETTLDEAMCDHDLVRGEERVRGIPIGVRRKVEARDRGRCRVPGCENRHRMALHHLVPFALGGPHTTSNLVTLCDRHHRIHHDGSLAIQGTGDGPIHVTWGTGVTRTSSPPGTSSL